MTGALKWFQGLITYTLLGRFQWVKWSWAERSSCLHYKQPTKCFLCLSKSFLQVFLRAADFIHPKEIIRIYDGLYYTERLWEKFSVMNHKEDDCGWLFNLELFYYNLFNSLLYNLCLLFLCGKCTLKKVYFGPTVKYFNLLIKCITFFNSLRFISFSISFSFFLHIIVLFIILI